jgi:hypothetical protein
MFRAAVGPFLLIAALIGCSDSTAPSAEGTWGGTAASLQLTRAGGTLSYPCGAGTIDSGWTLSQSGRFSGTGQHYFGGGPVPPEGHTPHPAVYDGRVEDVRLRLTVTLTDLGQVLGPFELVRGGPPVAEVCD